MNRHYAFRFTEPLALVPEVLSSFRFLNSTYSRSKAPPWNALPSRLRLALGLHLQLRRQVPPVHCVPRRSQGASAKNQPSQALSFLRRRTRQLCPKRNETRKGLEPVSYVIVDRKCFHSNTFSVDWARLYLSVICYQKMLFTQITPLC